MNLDRYSRAQLREAVALTLQSTRRGMTLKELRHAIGEAHFNLGAWKAVRAELTDEGLVSAEGSTHQRRWTWVG